MGTSHPDAELLDVSDVPKVRRANIAPQDVLVIECDQMLSRESAERLVENVKKIWPDNRCVVFDRGLKIKAISSHEAPVVTIGDRMRMSAELLQSIHAFPEHQSHVVFVHDVKLEEDGTKTLVLALVESPAPAPVP